MRPGKFNPLPLGPSFSSSFFPAWKLLFNASLDGNARRAIDLPEGATLDEAAFRDLIRAAAAANEQAQAARKKPRRT